MAGTAISRRPPLSSTRRPARRCRPGLLFGLRVVPYLAFGLVAGPVADRGNRRRRSSAEPRRRRGGADAPVADLLGVLTFGHVYAVALFSATAFVSPTLPCSRRSRARRTDPAAAANGILSSLAAGAEIVGPVIAGLASWAGNAVSIDATSFFVAAASPRSVHLPRHARSPAATPPHAGAANLIRGDPRSSSSVSGTPSPSAPCSACSSLCRRGARDWPPTTAASACSTERSASAASSAACCSHAFRPGRVLVLTPGTLVFSGVLALDLAGTTEFTVAVDSSPCSRGRSPRRSSSASRNGELVAPEHLRASVNVIGRMVSWGGRPFGAVFGALVGPGSSGPHRLRRRGAR